MSRFSRRQKFLDDIFHEENKKWSDVIVTTYRKIKIKNPDAYEIAVKRFRK